MESLYERVAYLRGLSEGLGIDENSKEGKLLLHIVETLDDFAMAISDLNEDHEDLAEYVDFMDEDLADLEDEVFGDLDDDDDDDDDYYDFDDDIDYVEIECPHCHEIIYLDEELIDNSGNAECPNCHHAINYVNECDCDDEDCDC